MFGGLGGLKDIGKMMKMASQLQENMAKAHAQAKARTAKGESGAGMVKVTVNGMSEVLAIEIDPEALKDPETLSPLLLSAVNLALTNAKAIFAEETKAAMGGMDLPPGILP